MLPGFRPSESLFYVEDSLEPLNNHPESKECWYTSAIHIVIALLRAQGIKVTVFGAEHIPAQGAGLLAMNHTGYYDFIFAGTVARVRGKRLVRFMGKKELFKPGVSFFMRKMKHISVDRSAGKGALHEAVERLQEGNLVGIFPEGTISRSLELTEFKTGAARIAHQAGVPLIPIVIWGSQRIWTKGQAANLGRKHIPVWVSVGEPIVCTGDAEQDTAKLYTAMQSLLRKLQENYSSTYGPFEPGQSWLPATMGGTAPTLEEADALNAAARAARIAKRAQRQAHDFAKTLKKKR